MSNRKKPNASKGWDERTEVQKYGGFVKKAMREPGFMAYHFRLWCERYNRSFTDVADELYCTTDDLVHIAMCGSPRAGHTEEDIKQVADKFRVSRVVLARIVMLCEPENNRRERIVYAENVHVEQRPPFDQL